VKKLFEDVGNVLFELIPVFTFLIGLGLCLFGLFNLATVGEFFGWWRISFTHKTVSSIHSALYETIISLILIYLGQYKLIRYAMSYWG